MSTNRPDEPVPDLVRRAQEGDRAAFEDLVKRYYRQIHRWALGISRDPDDADDVVQEVLVRLHGRIKSYAGRSRFSTWLFQVTRNTALAQQRKTGRRRSLMAGFQRGGAEDSSNEHASEDMESTQAADEIRALFERLPNRQREVFDLADLQGYEPAEIAKMLGMNPVTVRANLHKARRTIRGKMLERFPEMEKGYHA